MSTTTQVAPATKVVTGLVRFSYARVWEPVAIEEGKDKKYSVSIIIPKSDKETIKKINAALEAAIASGKDKFAGKKTSGPKFKMPLRDGDEERPDDEAYVNSYFVTASSKVKPGIIDKDKNEILDKDEFYSGCYGKASLNFYPFNTAGNVGIGCGLQNLLKMKDGEALGGGRSKAEDDFSDDLDDDLI